MGRTYRGKDHKFKQKLKESRKNRQNKRSIGNGDSEVRRDTNKNIRSDDRRDELEGCDDWSQNL